MSRVEFYISSCYLSMSHVASKMLSCFMSIFNQYLILCSFFVCHVAKVYVESRFVHVAVSNLRVKSPNSDRNLLEPIILKLEQQTHTLPPFPASGFPLSLQFIAYTPF